MSQVPDYPIVGIERIIQYVKERGAPYWVIYDSDRAATSSGAGRKAIADNLRHEGETLENGLRRLREFLSDYQDAGVGLVAFLWCKEKANASSGGYYTWIKITATNGMPPNPISGFPQIGAITPDDIEKRIQDALMKYQTEMRLKALEEENRELKRLAELETPVDRVIGRIEPYLDPLLKGIFTPAVPSQISGHQRNNNNADAGSAEKIVLESLKVLADGDDEIHLKLQKLAELKKTNPTMYQMAIGQLNNL